MKKNAFIISLLVVIVAIAGMSFIQKAAPQEAEIEEYAVLEAVYEDDIIDIYITIGNEKTSSLVEVNKDQKFDFSAVTREMQKLNNKGFTLFSADINFLNSKVDPAIYYTYHFVRN
jgi:regulatory protein YycI of two-component signal transduction system YycFG